jgi:hypothetical protein
LWLAACGWSLTITLDPDERPHFHFEMIQLIGQKIQLIEF